MGNFTVIVPFWSEPARLCSNKTFLTSQFLDTLYAFCTKLGFTIRKLLGKMSSVRIPSLGICRLFFYSTFFFLLCCFFVQTIYPGINPTTFVKVTFWTEDWTCVTKDHISFSRRSMRALRFPNVDICLDPVSFGYFSLLRSFTPLILETIYRLCLCCPS